MPDFEFKPWLYAKETCLKTMEAAINCHRHCSHITPACQYSSDSLTCISSITHSCNSWFNARKLCEPVKPCFAIDINPTSKIGYYSLFAQLTHALDVILTFPGRVLIWVVLLIMLYREQGTGEKIHVIVLTGQWRVHLPRLLLRLWKNDALNQRTAMSLNCLPPIL